MNYGYFDNEQMEYVVTNPKTPVKWINYVGGLDFGGFIDHTGGSLICKGDPALNRIVKYIPQLPSSEFKGETLYLRIRKENGYEIISPFFTPTLTPYESYKCRVGNGYNIIKSVIDGIETEVKIFIPVDAQVEIRDIKVTNLRDETVELDIIPLVEYTHFDAMKQFNNADWVPQTMQSELLKTEDGFTVLKQFAFMKKDEEVNYFTSNRAIDSFETDRRNFLGDNGYGTYINPLSLQNESLDNYVALREDNIAAALHKMGAVAKGESVRVITQLGQYSELEDELKQMARFRITSEVDQAFVDLAESFKGYFSKYQVTTPDEDTNTLINIHNPKQCLATKNWSRFLSLYQLGLGARGIGFRDTSQDLIGVMGLCPEETTDMMKKLLSTQRSNGSAMHQFFPLTMEATNGDSAEMEDRHDYYGDDHLWIIQTICAYVKETGNIDFLSEEVPYYEKDHDGQPLNSDTILNHMKKAIEFTESQTGQHGLPYLGFADWNDTVNLPIGAESIFNANLYGKALIELMSLFNYLGDQEQVLTYQAKYDKMKKAVNDTCWDGDWFVRYFDHQGEKIGSKVNPEGKIYTNAQSWTVISGFADGDRQSTALESVYEYLNTKNGIKLSFPGYNGYDPVKGGVSTYPPGAKENGGIFLHSNPWVMIAETMVGNGDRAFEYYSQINPISKNDKIDEFEVEPYVFPQNILGNEHPQFGLGRNSWLSGTASWVYTAGTKYILGIRPDYDGLIVDPCIPVKWDGFEVKRELRGKVYDIKITNPDHVSQGVKQLLVDGVEIEGNKIPLTNKDYIVVEVVMGK